MFVVLGSLALFELARLQQNKANKQTNKKKKLLLRLKKKRERERERKKK